MSRRVALGSRRWAPLVALFAGGCAAPDLSQLFNQLDLVQSEDEDGAAERFVEAIDGADSSLKVALPAGEDTTVSDAVLRAYARGVDVEVVTDYDLATTPAIAPLLEEGVPVALRDGGLTYFEFTLGDDAIFTSDMTRMAHAYAIADDQRLVAASVIGRSGPGTRLVFDVRGEDLVSDFASEHRQVYGGTDATAVDVYSAPAKSIVDTRWLYPMANDASVELWFGPQERVLKRVVDAVYSARSAVWVLTDDFANEGLAHALQDKAAWGFDVQVIVGPRFGVSSPLVSRVLEAETPAVSKRRLEDPDGTAFTVIPTIVLIDYPDDAEGYRPHTRAMVLNHDLYSAARLYRGAPLVTDQLIDSAMWVFADDAALTPELEAIEDVFRAHLDRSVEF